MEKKSILNGEDLNLIDTKKEILGKKLDNSWRETKVRRKSMEESKKLVVKLETCGKEKRKILLKLESGGSDFRNGNYDLISELLKEFFKDGKE